MSSVTLSGYIIVPNEILDEVMAALPAHVEATLKELGCLTFSVTQNTKNPNRFDVHETFVSKDALTAHQNRGQNSNWGRISKAIKRFYTVR